jgi:hypothetical protein
MKQYEWVELLKLFQVPHRRIYILGCFAQHVTIYSQQVRALNLIAALRRDGRLAGSPKVAVIGGGAAGLMAAAAAAFSGANVTVLDRLDGPMELQRNNRQRWLHPYIYDWPFTDHAGPEAQLPLMTWRAGYASDVAEQIQQQWRRLVNDGRRNSAGGYIQAYWSVSNVNVDNEDDGLCVTWTNSQNLNRYDNFALVIMAVGFGLEPEDDYRDSYWSEDQIDGDFRKPRLPQQWFVSGAGDGALTDVMRLCIRHFRHHEVAELFSAIDGIEELKKSLREIHPKNLDHNPRLVHNEFCKLLQIRSPTGGPGRWETLTNALRSRNILRSGQPIILASPSRFIYGPQSSILNRLILSQLEQLGRITHIPAATEDVLYEDRKYKIKLKDQSPFEVDHVIMRHGPEPALVAFQRIWADSAPLRELWKWRGLNRDDTRLRLWEPGEFGSEAGFFRISPLADTGPKVRAERLSVTKELRDDGSSYMKYEIQGLSVSRGSLRGLKCILKATTGTVGVPVLDEDANRLQMRWEEVDANRGILHLTGAKNRVRQISRILYFNSPLEPGHAPLNFGFSVALLNGDALSSWEFEQMYPTGEREHINGDPISGSEYVARYVWFPIEELTIRITLPVAISAAPSLQIFSCGTALNNTDMIRDGILQMLPPVESGLHPTQLYWPPSAETLARDAAYLRSTSRQTWELSVPKPLLGSCYSLNWPLPQRIPREPIARYIEEAAQFRERCLLHGQARRAGEQGDMVLQHEFDAMASKLRELYGLPPGDKELFEVSLMTYDESTKYLLTFEARVADEDRMKQKLGRFKLPFGWGLAGTAFKECDHAHMYLRSSPPSDTRPSNYLLFDAAEAHEALISIPFEHPEISALSPESELWETFDRPRTCLGVLNIGSDHVQSQLRDRLNTPETLSPEILRILDLCKSFATKLLNRTSIYTVVASETV